MDSDRSHEQQDAGATAPAPPSTDHVVADLAALFSTAAGLVELRIALLRTEFALFRSAAPRLLLAIPLTLLLLLCLWLSLLIGSGLLVHALTGSIALGWLAATLLQAGVLWGLLLRVRRWRADASFVHSRAQLRAAGEWMRSLAGSTEPANSSPAVSE
jgi:hypothetical protein